MPNHFSLGNLTLLQQKMVDLASQANKQWFSKILIRGAVFLSGGEAARCDIESSKLRGMFNFKLNFPNVLLVFLLVVVPWLLPNPLQLYSGISSDFDGSCFCGSYSLLDWLHQILSIPNQHFCGLNILLGSWKFKSVIFVSCFCQTHLFTLCTQHCCFYGWQNL